MRSHLLLLPLVLLVSGCAGATDAGTEGRDYPEPDAAAVAAAEERYADYVATEADALLAGTRRFAAAYAAGHDSRAREIYPQARTHWERIETVAESFGELDPRLDAREADLEDGQDWTGWHRIEKDLWPARAEAYTPLTPAERSEVTRRLVEDTATLVDEIADLELSVTDIADGTRGLLEEVANGKVTGEEEYWSRTDLHDFQANIDGAAEGFRGVESIVVDADPELAATIEQRFGEVQDLLDAQRRGDGFVGYDQLGADDVRALANAVNALSEPLASLSAVVAG